MIARIPIAVAALWLTVGMGFAAEAEPPHGLSKDGATYALVANNNWDVSSNGSGFAPATQKILIAKGSDTANSASDRQDRALIWARTCLPGPQTLVFRRDLFMPGPAKTFAADFFDTGDYAGAGDQAITSIVVFINDKKAFSFPGANVRISTTEKRLPKLFKFGMNRIEIKVVKRQKDNTIYGQCQYGNPKRPLGLFFVMYGEFGTDVWLSDYGSSVVTEVIRRRIPGLQTVNIGIPVKNFGPSGVYSGLLTVDVSGSGFAAPPQNFKIVPGSVRAGGKGLEDCRVTTRTSFGGRVECKIFRMPPGAKPVLRFTGKGTLPEGFDLSYVHVYSNITTPTRDRKLINNDARKIAYFCFVFSTNPKCTPVTVGVLGEQERQVFDPR